MKTVYIIEYQNGLGYEDNITEPYGVVLDKDLAEAIVEKLNKKLKSDYERYCYLSELTIRTDDEQKEYNNNYVYYVYQVDPEEEHYYHYTLNMYDSIDEIEA